MFGKDKKKEILSAENNKRKEKVLDVDASMQGNLNFKDPVDLRINGSFEGELTTKGSLTIGKEAKVKAKISGDEIIIAGIVKGDINAKKRIELIPPAKVIGTIITPSLTVKEGAIFKGACDMGIEDDFLEDLGSGKDFLTTKEVAEYLELDIATVREWANEGKLPSEKRGNSWLFNKQELDKWIAEDRVPTKEQ